MGTNSAQTPRRLSAGETRRLSIAWYIEQVGEEPDESQQRQGDERADHSDQGGHARQRQDAPVGREVAEPIVRLEIARHEMAM